MTLAVMQHLIDMNHQSTTQRNFNVTFIGRYNDIKYESINLWWGLPSLTHLNLKSTCENKNASLIMPMKRWDQPWFTAGCDQIQNSNEIWHFGFWWSKTTIRLIWTNSLIFKLSWVLSYPNYYFFCQGFF